MHDINLLRPLIEQEKEQAKSKGRFGFYLSFTIILLLLIFGLIFGTKFYLIYQAKTLDQEIAGLKKDTAQVQGIEDNINNFNSTIAKLKGLDKNKLTWSIIYDNIAKSTPPDIKLNQVAIISSTASASAASSTQIKSPTSTSIASAAKLKITGETKSRRAIALFVYKLQKLSDNFAVIEIISSKKTGAEAGETETGGEIKIDFEINVSLKS